MPLHAAAFGSDLYTFRRYLGSSLAQDVLSSTNNHGESLLHYAAAGGKVGILRFLLEESPQTNLDVSRANSNGWAPLICALAPSHNNGSFSLPTHDEDSCVEWPYSSGSYAKAGPKTPAEAIQAAQLLLSHGADPSAVTAEGWSALHLLACYEQVSRRHAVHLASGGADPQGRTAASQGEVPDARTETGRVNWSAAEGYRPEFGGNFPWGPGYGGWRRWPARRASSRPLRRRRSTGLGCTVPRRWRGYCLLRKRAKAMTLGDLETLYASLSIPSCHRAKPGGG